MIKLPYDYTIETNQGGGYTLNKVRISATNKQYNDIMGYFTTISSCINHLYKLRKEYFVKENDIDLKQYIEYIEKLNLEFKQLLEEKLKENI